MTAIEQPTVSRSTRSARLRNPSSPTNSSRTSTSTSASSSAPLRLTTIDYWDTQKLQDRLNEVRAIVDALPPAGRKPLWRLGYVGTSKWDSSFAKYDNATQAYYMIGDPQSGWPLYPLYNFLRLTTSVVQSGWSVVGDGVVGPSHVVATDAAGVATFSVPQQGVFVLTTLRLA